MTSIRPDPGSLHEAPSPAAREERESMDQGPDRQDLNDGSGAAVPGADAPETGAPANEAVPPAVPTPARDRRKAQDSAASGPEPTAAHAPEDAAWYGRGMVTTVIVAVAVITGAVVYLLFKDTGGSAALAALIAVGAVLVPASVALIYSLALSGRIKRNRLLGEAFDALASPRAVLGTGLEPLATNEAYRKVFGNDGRSPLEVLEERLPDTDSIIRRLASLRKAAMTGRTGEAEFAFRAATGGHKWYRFSVGPAGADHKNVLLRVDDVTSLKRRQDTEDPTLNALSDLAEDVPIGLYSVDSDGRFNFINRTLLTWLATDPDAINKENLRLADFIPGPRQPGAAPWDPFGDNRASGEATLEARDGRRFRVQISQDTAGEESDTGLRTRSAVWNLTENRELAAALRTSEPQFQRIFEDSPVGIALLDLAGAVVKCNTIFADIFGGDRESLVGKDLVTLLSEDDRAEATNAISEVTGGRDRHAPLEVRPEDNADAAAALSISRLFGPEGGASGLMVHALDTTEQRNLEVQFAQSQKMQAVGQLAGGIAHDFNNLLTAMIGFCDLLLLRHRPGEESFGDIMQIKQNANRAANLVRQLLAFSRQQTLESKVLNITDVLTELMHLLQRLMGEAVELKVLHGRDLGMVRVDQGQLEQVIINLAVNARDAMVEGGTLTIRTSNVSAEDAQRRGHEIMPAGEYILTEVIDTGMGIPKENQGRIFEPFFSTKEVGAGTGLGLSTVYGIVKQTGGFIFVESAEGKGATFQIFLPRHDKEGEAGTVRPKSDPDEVRDLTGVGTVLLVEDEDAVRSFGARALRNKGYNVIEANSGEDALRTLEEGDDAIDLLITDVVMPNMDGPTLIKSVREQWPDLRVICISGYAEDGFRKRLDESADIHFLPKPFSLKQLAGKVKDVMGT